MGSLAALLLWPRRCIQGSRGAGRGQPKLRQSGQARPAKPGERQIFVYLEGHYRTDEQFSKHENLLRLQQDSYLLMQPVRNATMEMKNND
ncbi:hypothetical protein PFLUV_G00112410 [Perca fluviatilis]|uniref:Uncharacterized protein n=1 Tax=Perca fluviatilis TaxID=8168 RepID=A0A6A5F6C7_PERFL|nr:hypothetical protein PFLUV_G00112410 [Perca fluviatilis]